MPSDAPEAQILSVTIGDAPPARLDKALARDVPEPAGLSRSRLAKLIEAGDVRRAGQVMTSPKARVAAGDVIEITLAAPVETALLAEPIPLDIRYEDSDLVLVNKPAGMVVHPAPGAWTGTLVNALMHHCGDSLSGIGGEKRPGIVHRIDKLTSGLLVAAKSDKAHAGLAAQFAAHSVRREYVAFVHGVPDAADPRLVGQPIVGFEPGGILKITAPIGRHRHDRQKMAVVAGGRHAVTRARREAVFGAPPVISKLTCWLETGRTHQIRVHLAKVGHSLVGDPVYGAGRKISQKALGGAAERVAHFPRQALHAATLGFVHPVTGVEMAFAAELPEDLQALEQAMAGLQ